MTLVTGRRSGSLVQQPYVKRQSGSGIPSQNINYLESFKTLEPPISTMDAPDLPGPAEAWDGLTRVDGISDVRARKEA
jgi:hypothetical protein